jgi:hypothetical protein
MALMELAGMGYGSGLKGGRSLLSHIIGIFAFSPVQNSARSARSRG